MKTINDRTFGPGDVVQLDGFTYLRCSFDSCSFTFEGTGDFHFEECLFRGNCRATFSETVDRVMAGLLALHEYGITKVVGFTDETWNAALRPIGRVPPPGAAS